jgi:hypothetical protein
MGGGGASGSSGVPSNTSGQAVAYQPTAQPQSDLLYQNLLGGFAGGLGPQISAAYGSLFPGSTTNVPNAFSGTPGGTAYGYAQPFVGGTGSGTITDPNNPYYQQQQGAANWVGSNVPDYLLTSGLNQVGLGGGMTWSLPAAYAASTGTADTTASQLAALAQQLGGFTGTSFGQQAGQATSDAGVLNQIAQEFTGAPRIEAQDIGPAALNASAALTNNIGAAVPSVMGGATAGANALNQYGNQILGTAFDPQGALYNQLQNQAVQQSEAAASAAGLGGSAYGASTVGNNLNNFNINWQNQQLARQAQGLGAAEPAFTTAAGLPGSAASSLGAGLSAAAQGGIAPEQLGASLTSQIGQILQGADTLPANVAQQYATLGGQTGQLGSAAAALPFQPYTQGDAAAQSIQSILSGGAGLEGSGVSLAGLPLQTQTGNTSNALSALGNLVNIGNQQYTVPQQTLNDLQSYLQLGQAASGLSGQLGALGLNEQQSSLAGIGSALGTGSNLLFGNSLGGSGGLLGATGLNPFSSASGAGSAAGSVFGSDLGGVGATTDFAGGGDVAAGFAPIADTGAAAASSGSFGLGSLLPFGAS